MNDATEYDINVHVIGKMPPNYVSFTSAEPFALKLVPSTVPSAVSDAKQWEGTMETSADGAIWNEWVPTSENLLSEAAGQNEKGDYVLYVRGTGNAHISSRGETIELSSAPNYTSWTLQGTNNVAAAGNIENLFDWQTVAKGKHPAMNNSACYSMFRECTALTTAPELPVTTLANYCYARMFQDCTALTAAPELPATTLATNCYSSMFSDCTALEALPDLPITSGSQSYRDMFKNCTSVSLSKTATESHTQPYVINTSGTTNTLGMFEGTAGYVGETADGSNYMPAGTYYVRASCTVSYDKNNDAATGTMGARKIMSGQEHAAPRCNFELAGMDFSAWNTAADGSGTAYAMGELIPITGDLTLYAQWTDHVDEPDEPVVPPVEPTIHTHDDGLEFVEWDSGDALPAVEGSYALTKDVVLTDSWTVPQGTVNLCLNGHNITLADDAEGLNVIIVPTSTALNLYNCEDEGSISGAHGNTRDNVAGVYVAGMFCMYGGTISGNGGSMAYGGGVYYSGETAQFEMHGGKITGNTAMSGGGVYVGYGAAFTMSGGEISGNKVAASDAIHGGSGVMVNQAASMTMTGGKISGNSIIDSDYSAYGGGVFLLRGGSLTMSDGEISGNSAAQGGGVAVFSPDEDSASSLTMSGGKISENTATQSSGGVYLGLTNTNFSISGTPVIQDNQVNDTKNNVVLAPGTNVITILAALEDSADVGITLTGEDQNHSFMACSNHAFYAWY